MISYELLKEASQEIGVSVTNLLALSPSNDPYAVGTPRAKRMANWFKNQVWDKAGYTSGVHLRRAHYWAVSKEIKLPQKITQALPGGKGKSDNYFNTQEAWQFLCKASMYARYFGLVDIESIVDNKNPTPSVFTQYTGNKDDISYSVWLDDLERPYVTARIPTISDLQPYHLEIWCEKSTMNDVLEPLASSYHAVLCTFQGEASLTACSNFVDRVKAANKPARVMYISDFDAAGISMPKAVARKVEWVCDNRGLDLEIAISQVALTLEQVKDYNLPTTPMKPKEKRADAFMERTGIDGAVELDALEALYPGDLAEIVREWLEPYFSQDAADWHRSATGEIESRVKEEVKKVNEKFSEMLTQFKEYQKAISRITVEVDDLELDGDQFEVRVDELDDDFLYDSERDYLSQIKAYKNYNHESLELSFEEEQTVERILGWY